MNLPRSLALTSSEQGILTHLTIREHSAMDFWKDALASRGIRCPPSRVLMMISQGKGEFRLEWHQKALGPQAIAQGIAYRAFAARKDREFAARAGDHA